MYVGVDVGGTKTLVAVLDDSGQIVERDRFPTPKKYEDFLSRLDESLSHFMHHDFKAGGIGIPSTRIDRKHGIGRRFGNLTWRDVPIQADLEKLCGCPLVLENDAKMGALSESMLLKDKYQKVLYVTISTGIGYGLVNDHQIDSNVGDGGGRMILLEHHGRPTPWEDFAGGRAIAERFGKPASDIKDKKTWQIISHDLAKGFIHLIALMQPDVIVIGGSVGHYFERYHEPLQQAIAAYEIPLVKLPDLREAQRPDEAVVFGCYDLAKQVLGHA